MVLTDEQLMLLEQLAYIHDAGAPLGDLNGSMVNRSVADIVNCFGDEELADMENQSESGAEWAAIIRAVKSDDELMSLQPAEHQTTVDEGVFCYRYTTESGMDRAVVVFAGTRTGEEWVDNFEGLNVADTSQQREALAVIDSLPYDSISVVGHSKGGNKAQYVTLLSDKVDQCLSMDGQGFSQEFLDKYWPEIQAKGTIIKNYSLSNDFVNILLFPVPGSEQRYYDGGRNPGGMNHSPEKFFVFEEDESGHMQIKLGEDGKPILIETKQSDVMSYLHDFTCFIVTNGTEKDKKVLIQSLGPFVALLRSNTYRYELNGKVYTQENALQFLASDMDSFALAIAYFVKYVDVNGFSNDQIIEFLTEMGMADPQIVNLINENGIYISYLINQLKDGNKDGITAWALDNINKLEELRNWVKDNFGISLSELYLLIDAKYNNLDPSVGSFPIHNGVLKSGRIFDYRYSTYQIILDTIGLVERQTSGSVSGWSKYQGEDWYDCLLVSRAIQGINLYWDHLESVNKECRDQISRIFEDVSCADISAGTLLSELSGAVLKSGTGLEEIFASLM